MQVPVYRTSELPISSGSKPSQVRRRAAILVPVAGVGFEPWQTPADCEGGSGFRPQVSRASEEKHDEGNLGILNHRLKGPQLFTFG